MYGNVPRPPTPPPETEPIMIDISREEFFRLVARIEELAIAMEMETARIEEIIEDNDYDIDDEYQRRWRVSVINNIDYLEEEIDRVFKLLVDNEHYLEGTGIVMDL